MERFGHEVIEDDYNHFVDQLISQLNIYCTAGSGWVVESLLAVEIKVAAPIRETGSSYIETPASLSGLRRSILNVKNKRDEFCFLYSVLAALYPQKKNVDRPSSYVDKFDELHFQKSDFPMCLSKIRFFEKRNDLSITVYRFENETLQNIYHSKNRTSRRKIKLLLLEGQKSHYCLIKNFSNLMHQLHRSSKSDVKVRRVNFVAIAFNPSSDPITENILSFARITNHWKLQCLNAIRHCRSTIGKKHNGVLLLSMQTWKLSMSRVSTVLNKRE